MCSRQRTRCEHSSCSKTSPPSTSRIAARSIGSKTRPPCPPCSRQDYLLSGPCLQVSAKRRYVSKMRQPIIDMSTAPVDELTAMSSTIPSTGSTFVATTTVMTTCSASADCIDSATPTYSGDVCVTMLCGCGSFTPDGAYDSLWDNVKPMMA